MIFFVSVFVYLFVFILVNKMNIKPVFKETLEMQWMISKGQKLEFFFKKSDIMIMVQILSTIEVWICC